MSPDQMKALVRRVPEEMFGEGNLAVADEVFAADFVDHAPLPPGFPEGIAGVKAFVTGLRAAFPDFHYTLEDEIADGDKVVIRLTARGTQSGEFLGMPAMGKQATWTEIHIARVVDGKVAEHWVESDRLGMLQQLGVIPTPG